MASLHPEVITQIGGFHVTNTVTATLLTDAIIVLLLIIAVKNIKRVPTLFQVVVESAIEYFYSLTAQISGKNTDKIFPWFMSFFLVIFLANLVGLLPGFGSIGFFENKEAHASNKNEVTHEATKPISESETTLHKESTDDHTVLPENNHKTQPAPDAKALESTPVENAEETGHESGFIPLFRGATSDFNVTLALATVSLIATHIIAFRTVGFRDYISRYISLNPVLLFVGILELVSEVTKLFSLSFRLFGNIYAGEVVLATISSLFAYVAPIPFIMLELIVALVQALVFSMLTMVFMSILATPHGEGEAGH